jgi:hypothetical protein
MCSQQRGGSAKLISELYGFRQLRTGEGDMPYWICREPMEDVTKFKMIESSEWEKLTPKELALVAHEFVVDVRLTKIPLVVLLMNVQKFLVPAQWKTKITVTALIMSQSLTWRNEVQAKWKRVSKKNEEYMKKRFDEVLNFFNQKYHEIPLNLSFGIETCNILILDKEGKPTGEVMEQQGDTEKIYVSVNGNKILSDEEPEQRYHEQETRWKVVNHVLVKRKIIPMSKLYCVLEMSYGKEVFAGKHFSDLQVDTTLSFQIDNVLWTKTDLLEHMERVDKDELRNQLTSHVEYPPLTLSKMDPLLYSAYLSYYSHEVRENHSTIVKTLIPYLSPPLIVPCDGEGTWENLWTKYGIFGDKNYENRRLKKETCGETLRRATKFKTGTIILMYCVSMMMEDEMRDLEEMVNKNYQLIVIDTSTRVLPFKMKRVNNLMRISENMHLPPMAAFLHDTERTMRNVKYSNLLLDVEDPRFFSSNIYSDYWRLMRPLKVSKEITVVYANLAEWLVGRNTYNGSCYVASAGLTDPKVAEFFPHKPLFQRQIYRCAREWFPIIPAYFDKVQTSEHVYFSCIDEQYREVKFVGYQKGLQMNLMLEFQAFEARGKPLNFVEMMRTYKNRYFTFEEIESMCRFHCMGYRREQVELAIKNTLSITVRSGTMGEEYAFTPKKTEWADDDDYFAYLSSSGNESGGDRHVES